MIWQKALALKKASQSFVIVTLLDIKGSAPQDIGAKMIAGINGIEQGTIGGGKLEAQSLLKVKEILKSNKKSKPEIVKWNLQRDIHMTCGGEVSLLFEYFPAATWSIVIFGAGHIAQALSRVLTKLDCRLTVIDDRQEWIEKLSDVNKIHSEIPSQYINECDDKTFFISVTKGHSSDLPVILEIYKQFPFAPYIGVIGSSSKARVLKRELKALGVDDRFLKKLRIPIGMPIGNNNPEEISISIAAELLQVRDQVNLSIYNFNKQPEL